MKRHLFTFILLLLVIGVRAEKIPTVYVDAYGVMRWSDTKKEASFYGVNYTLPFAHAYRAIGYLGLDHQAAIDQDVYHFARLGFNAYRIHVWDVELSDSLGNLQANHHLDLLDYLIARLQERGIRIVITAQTNFGNGYPEHNQPTGGFSYLYDKCSIHSHPDAIAAQERYIASLVKHVNPYTGRAYLNDPYIVGFEINNEPCHTGTQAETKTYIDRMLTAIKQTGNRKPVFYNVSHNLQQVEAYYATTIAGTTYQWYPIGLVSGHTRRGNFLPYVDDYPIPFHTVKGFKQKARLVYEFDPADITYAYMYPAMTRTFRTSGFQWITQFAYDPMEMAWANTEYQTHFLNLAYTPQKALSMKIAAEAARLLPLHASYGTYPADTTFGAFRVSYVQDLSEMNTPEKFFYSNTTHTRPVAPERLQSIAGYGNSPLVSYEGMGAYFIDRLEAGTWRLEVMPDAIEVSDPFAKPSLRKEVVTILHGSWPMTLRLPDLGDAFTITGLNSANTYQATALSGVIEQLTPGVYLLQSNRQKPTRQWTAEHLFGNIRLGEYIAPQTRVATDQVIHHPLATVETDCPFVIEAQVIGPTTPDSVILYTDKVSFWAAHNPHIKLTRTHGYTYRATIPAQQVKEEGSFRYNIVVCRDGGRKHQSFPANVSGMPLDWDYTSTCYFTIPVVAPASPIRLLTTLAQCDHFEQKESPHLVLRKYIKDLVTCRTERLRQCTHLCLEVKQPILGASAGFVTSDGYTYRLSLSSDRSTAGIIRMPLSELEQSYTALLPVPYPTFLDTRFHPTTPIPFDIHKIESIEFTFSQASGEVDDQVSGGAGSKAVGNVWLE